MITIVVVAGNEPLFINDCYYTSTVPGNVRDIFTILHESAHSYSRRPLCVCVCDPLIYPRTAYEVNDRFRTADESCVSGDRANEVFSKRTALDRPQETA